MTNRSIADEEALSIFMASADLLRKHVGGLSDAELDYAAEPGGWTIRQMVHHVADDCDIWSMCIKKALATPGALVRFEGFPGNEPWADGLAFEHREVQTALGLIAAHRAYLAALLRFFADGWDRCVQIANAEGEVMQEMSVREMVGMLTDHMLEHVEAIGRVQAG